MCLCSVCVFEHIDLRGCPQRPEDGVKSPGARGTRGCEPINVDAGNWTRLHILNNCWAILPALRSLCNFNFCPKETSIQARNVSVQYVSCYLKCPDFFKEASQKYRMVNCKTDANTVTDKEKRPDTKPHRPILWRYFQRKQSSYCSQCLIKALCSTSPGAHRKSIEKMRGLSISTMFNID